MWAVGSPSVIMMICFVPVSAGEHPSGSSEPVLHVGAVHEVPGDLRELFGLISRATSLRSRRCPGSRGGTGSRSACASAIATFLAARKLSRIGIERERSSISTVDARVECLGPLDLEVVGTRRTGVPRRHGVTAL